MQRSQKSRCNIHYPSVMLARLVCKLGFGCDSDATQMLSDKCSLRPQTLVQDAGGGRQTDREWRNAEHSDQKSVRKRGCVRRIRLELG
eukprot:3506664-Rhodomonas_salina.2